MRGTPQFCVAAGSRAGAPCRLVRGEDRHTFAAAGTVARVVIAAVGMLPRLRGLIILFHPEEEMEIPICYSAPAD